MVAILTSSKSQPCVCCPGPSDGPNGLSRRGFLRIGGGFLGFLLANRVQWGFAEDTAAAPRAKNLIILWMSGGPSQLDTFDLKPGRPTGGPFKAIPTAVPGIEISENLPTLAKQAKHLAIVRSMTSKEGNHQRATYLLHTGYPPMGTVTHPGIGSIVSMETGREDFELPHYVSIASPSQGAGFLGVAHSPFVVDDPNRPIDNLKYPTGVDEDRFDARMALLAQQEKDFGKQTGGDEVKAHQAVYFKAVKMMRSPLVKSFNLEEEKKDLRDAYGRNRFGQGCLMARRLVESGVKCVEVSLGGWDTHRDNFTAVKRLSQTLDQGFATLLQDLQDRRMLDQTLILWMGEFGRTPKVNENDGRDHYPQAWTAAMAGGGVKGGMVLGSTDEDGRSVKDRPVKVPDLFATVYQQLGVNWKKVNKTPQGRPIKIVDGGSPVQELI